MKFFKLSNLLQSWSMWIFGLIAVLPQVAEQLQLLGQQGSNTLSTALALLGIVARSIKQPKLAEPAE